MDADEYVWDVCEMQLAENFVSLHSRNENENGKASHS